MITLAIPFYKRLDYLKLAIESVLAQTSGNWRLVVSDDGGNEPGVETAVASYQDPRIEYSLSPHHLGMVGNWNRCLQLAGTPYVTLLHADDELLPNYIEAMEAAWNEHRQATAIFCQPKVIGAQGKPVFSFPDVYKRVLIPSTKATTQLQGEKAVVALLKGNFIFCPTLCYRKAALADLRFDPRWKMVQDLDLTLKVLMKGDSLVGIPDVAYAYRRHGANATATYNQSLLRFEEETMLFREMSQRCREKGWKLAEKEAKAGTIVRLHLAYRIVEDLLLLRWKEAFRKTRFLHRHLTGA